MSQLELSYRPVAQIPAGICFDAAARHILQALPGRCSTHLLGVLLLFSYTRNPKPYTRNPKPETRNPKGVLLLSLPFLKRVRRDAPRRQFSVKVWVLGLCFASMLP
jgi:hypothetical protein